ncbi:uncharacterized protein LOC118276102 isoform X2 [Spodoptera frugiperda]|uniref:Uncharacterized protein LOC118276102 isoform X2 n=1 Tax=Spodoptera frugiperda TaxID=7108 RepID=A0A9R0EQZ8_SPOFR|nr:uncharacterized protein LOC118276102 isoform X2 [Spodoptera frugiperda]
MVLGRVHCAFCVILVFQTLLYCDGQFAQKNYETISPLPFPTCRADNVDCLRRSLRTFFFLMDAGHFGMQPVDPVIVNSVTVSLPEEQTTFSLRRVNVTGARWTKLVERRFGLENGKAGVVFLTDLHLTGQLSMEVAGRPEPHNAFLTMDIQGAESNITYLGNIQRGRDNEDYIVIGPERIAIRNRRIPSYFLQPNSEDAYTIDEALQKKPSILDHISNEITAAIMHSVVDNFRLFSMNVPIRYYYKYYNEK